LKSTTAADRCNSTSRASTSGTWSDAAKRRDPFDLGRHATGRDQGADAFVTAAHAALCTARQGVGSCAVPAAAIGSWPPRPLEEDGDPPANAMLPEAHREALMRHAGDD